MYYINIEDKNSSLQKILVQKRFRPLSNLALDREVNMVRTLFKCLYLL